VAVLISSDATGLVRASGLPSSITDLTICCWVYHNSYDPSGSGWSDVLTLGTSSSYTFWFAYDHSKSQDPITVGTSGNQANNMAGANATGAWYFIACTLDSGTGIAYRATDPTASIDSYSASSMGSLSSITRMTVGQGQPDWDDEYIDGRIAHLKIWFETVLTPQQLRIEAMSARPIHAHSTLWGWYPFAASDVTLMLRDFSGNGNNLSNNGSNPSIADGPPVGWGAAPIYLSAAAPTFSLSGVTKDEAGDPLGSCDVYLCKDNGDDTASFVAHQVSHATTGAYSFVGIVDDDAAYFVLAFKSGGLMDATDHVLQPV
jgi:hypothetical protein